MRKPIISKSSITPQEKLKDLLSQTIDDNGCMIWTRCLNTDGYPHMLGNVKVHRLVYELNSGENIKGLVVRHTCDNPKCINPNHLLKGTPRENMMDRNERSGNGIAKLTKDQVRAIRLLDGKFMRTEIANMFGVSPQTISSLLLGKHWKHVA